MFDSPAIRRAINEREQRLASFYQMQRRAGSCPIEATEAMGEFAGRLDAAAARVADDRFNRDLAVIRSVMERIR